MIKIVKAKKSNFILKLSLINFTALKQSIKSVNAQIKKATVTTRNYGGF